MPVYRQFGLDPKGETRKTFEYHKQKAPEKVSRDRLSNLRKNRRFDYFLTAALAFFAGTAGAGAATGAAGAAIAGAFSASR
jgi:hypothetical protein